MDNNDELIIESEEQSEILPEDGLEKEKSSRQAPQKKQKQSTPRNDRREIEKRKKADQSEPVMVKKSIIQESSNKQKALDKHTTESVNPFDSTSSGEQ